MRYQSTDARQNEIYLLIIQCTECYARLDWSFSHDLLLKEEAEMENSVGDFEINWHKSNS